MSFYSDASLVFIPSGYKASKAYSAKPTDGTGDLTFTRSNDTATRVASNGLIEKVRTNLTLNSQTGASWTSSGSTIDSTTTADPLGGTDAVQFTALGGENSQVLSDNTISFSSGDILTGSVYVKNVDADFAQLTFSPGSRFTSGQRQNFDLTNGTLADGSGLLGSSIEDVGGGWYRISISATTTNSTGSGAIVLSIAPSGSAARLDDATAGQTLIAFGFQFERGDVMTDYIATTTAAVSVGPLANVPRLDYLGSSCPRLLLEPQRTNLVTYSENFDNAAYSKTNVSVTANTSVSPDGYANADTILSTAASPQLLSPVITFGAATNASVFVKYVSQQFVQLFGGGAFGDFANFDIQNATLGTSGASTANAKIENYGNGWLRISATFSGFAGGTTARLGFTSASNAGWNSLDSAFNKSVLAYGFQAEVGAYATSYIPTLGAAVTRGVDAMSKSSYACGITTEATLFADFEYQNTGSGYSTQFLIYKSGGNYLYMYVLSNTIRAICLNGNAVQSSIIASSTTAGTRYKVAARFKANDFAMYINGTLIGTDTSGTMPTFDTSFSSYIGNDTSQAEPAGYVNQYLVFPTALSNSDLAALTA